VKHLVPSIPINHLSTSEGRWFAVYTRYKSEKQVFDHLSRKGIECYLPLMNVVRRYTRKIKKYEIPLINCYIFVFINKDQYISVLETENVIKFLRQGADLISIPSQEIEILKRITGYISDLSQIDQIPISIGDEVEVMSGSLVGLKGKIIAQTNKKTFVVELVNIGYQFVIDIDIALLRTINMAKRIA
jgi:transcription antitermination factor NusG